MRRFSLAVLSIGAIPLVAAVVWNPVVMPQLTKLPTSLNATAEYAGTYTWYSDGSTGLPLPTPQQMPLTAKRTTKALPSKSTGSRLVATQVTSVTTGGKTLDSTVGYVLDRSTGKALTGQGAWALMPSNTVDRRGAYVLGLPMNVNTAKTYLMWQEEIGAPLNVVSKHSVRTIAGVKTELFSMDTGPTSMTANYVTASKMPTSVPFTTLVAQLRASGLDFTTMLSSLVPALSPAEKTALATAQRTPIALNYYLSTSTEAYVDPVTGEIVDLAKSRQEVTVKPDLAALATSLGPVVLAHRDLPVVQRLLPAMGTMISAAGQKIYTVEFAQTPASVSSTARAVARSVGVLGILTVWVPIGLALLGLILIAVAWMPGARTLVSLLVRGRRRQAPEVALADDDRVHGIAPDQEDQEGRTRQLSGSSSGS